METNVTSKRLDPVPSMLIESMRDIGYSFETALADIIDNSLAADATEIRIEARATPEPIVAICDNGHGLTHDELFSSMRMGSADPRKLRNENDLGRYGLGLKTASFSQCRKMTVLSRKSGSYSAFAWDLDLVVKTNEWYVLEIADCKEIPFNELLQDGDGTLVVWENIDRIGDSAKDKHSLESVFNRQVSEAEEHIALVFHRFLATERGYKKVTMTLNGVPIEPLDPFNSQHEATIIHPVEPVSEGVTVQSFTLPHSSKYSSKEEYEKYGLVGGYQKNQGIYLYRARRLIIYGTWFNLAKKTALTQLCRVKIDIDNNHDEDWKIDVKKVSAQLPEEVRATVRNLINTFNSPSKKVYRRRGARQTSASLYPVWKAVKDNGGIAYRINREHPNIAGALLELDAEDAKHLEVLFRLIESGFPTESLYYELSNNPESVTTPPIEESDLAEISNSFFGMMKSQGNEDEKILNIMRSLDIFEGRWGSVLEALGIEEQ